MSPTPTDPPYLPFIQYTKIRISKVYAEQCSGRVAPGDGGRLRPTSPAPCLLVTPHQAPGGLSTLGIGGDPARCGVASRPTQQRARGGHLCAMCATRLAPVGRKAHRIR